MAQVAGSRETGKVEMAIADVDGNGVRRDPHTPPTSHLTYARPPPSLMLHPPPRPQILDILIGVWDHTARASMVYRAAVRQVFVPSTTFDTDDDPKDTYAIALGDVDGDGQGHTWCTPKPCTFESVHR